MSNIESLYPHNKKVFLEAMENLKTHKKLGIVQATGTGKGKLASCFVEHVLKRKPNAKILILAPLHTILDNYRDNFGLTDSEVSFNTYKMLLSFDKTYLHNLGLTYDLIIVDEFHRLGAEKWGPAVKTIFAGVDNPKSICRVIGFTATPIRYLDNARDMSDELFGSNVIQGLNLEDAICEGILPGFVYNACYFSTEDKLAEVEKKLASNDYKIVDDTIRNDLMVKVKELRMLYRNKLKIENILKETTKDLGTNQKWVIFCRDKDSLDEIREICKSWFVSVPSLYVIHSDKYRSDNRRILKEFRESKSGVNVLLCIDMLNEGVHIKDISGIIMLRKTDSPIIFLQQLGRALEAGKTTQPLIYDLVGNYKDLKVENGDGLVGNTISIVKGIAEKVNKRGSSNCVIVRNFVEDFDKVMEEINSVLPSYWVCWSDFELTILKECYPSGGSKLCIENGVDKKIGQIHAKAAELGISYLGDLWTEEEDLIIKTYYQDGGSKACIEHGLNKNIRSIQYRASVLGIKSMRQQRSYSDIDVEKIKQYYPIGGYALCVENGVSLSKSTVHNIVKKYKLSVDDSWKSFEDDIIKKYYSTGGYKLCQSEGLSYKSERKIKDRANFLGVTLNSLWSDDDINLLREYYPKGGSDLCIKMGLQKSPDQIRSMSRRLKVYFQSNGANRYSVEEEDLLRRYYPIGGYKLCIEKGLNRPENSIHRKAATLGLCQKISFSIEEDNIIKKYYSDGGADLCIQNGLYNKSKAAIQHRASALGVVQIKRRVWRIEEDDILRNYIHLGLDECKKHGLSHRSDESLRYRANMLGLTIPCSYDEVQRKRDDEIIIKYYPIGGYKLCVEKGISKGAVHTIRNRARTLGVSYKEYAMPWSAEEDKLIILYYPVGGIPLCRKHGLNNRSDSSIHQHALTLGLKRPTSDKLWTEEEDKILRTFFPDGGARLCIEHGLNRSESGIRFRARKLGLKLPDR